MFTIKHAAAFTSAVLLAASLTSCAGKEDAAPASVPETETSFTETASLIESTTEQNPTAEQTEQTQNLAYRAAYAKKLSALRTKFGAPKGEYSVEKNGVLFADLLDWDRDGTPELFTLTHEGIVNDWDTFRFQIWKEQDGTAVSLLDTVVNSSHGFLSSDLDFYLMRSNEGVLTVCVDDSHEFADLKETYYTLSDGTVQSTVLTAQSSVGGWTEDAEPLDPDAYQIDGITCEKAAFNVRRSALGRDKSLSVYCQHIYDTAALDAFLTEQSDVYAGGAWLEAAEFTDNQPLEWLDNAVFTK